MHFIKNGYKLYPYGSLITKNHGLWAYHQQFLVRLYGGEINAALY